METEYSFVWDEQSQLYFHASSGFYHDPNAGWYYSTRDGLYYKFEDGNYVLLESQLDKGDKYDHHEVTTVPNDQSMEQPTEQTYISFTDNPECLGSLCSENIIPTSEWLEDTLIDLYLSGYSNPTINADNDMKTSLDKDDVNFNAANDMKTSLDMDDGKHGDYELEEGEWIPEDHESCPSENVSGPSMDEENWLAQYGQVIQSNDLPVLTISAVDLWDWEKVTSVKKDGKDQVARLVGRLVRRSVKLHPGMPPGGGRLKTAPICEVYLDLVRVRSGQVYKLRSPSSRFLASLSTYDSTNPTKDWDFPEISADRTDNPLSIPSRNLEAETVCRSSTEENPSMSQCLISKQHKSHAYRDRAAERRSLHGGFGVGPGQKKVGIDDSDPGSPSSPVATCMETASAEALNMSFGTGSYARRLLENMGWKEGEALGDTRKGLKEPLQATGNKGNAGLGWTNHDRAKRF